MQIRDEDPTADMAFNLAPMIDVVFLLLIFFMVATTFIERERELDVELPVAESGEELGAAPHEIVIHLRRDGAIVLGGEEVDRERLVEALRAAARRDPSTPVTIRGDKRVFHEVVVGVMDACRVAGLSNLGVMTLDG